MKDVSIMIDDVKFNLRAGIMITCNDEVLVEVNPNLDFVTLPGGRVHALENTKETLIREMTEEMNFELPDTIKLRGIIENFFEFDEKKYHELYFLYKYDIKNDSKLYSDNMINEDSKKTYFKWVKKNELDRVNLLPSILREWALSDGFDQATINDLPIKGKSKINK